MKDLTDVIEMIEDESAIVEMIYYFVCEDILTGVNEEDRSYYSSKVNVLLKVADDLHEVNVLLRTMNQGNHVFTFGDTI